MRFWCWFLFFSLKIAETTVTNQPSVARNNLSSATRHIALICFCNLCKSHIVFQNVLPSACSPVSRHSKWLLHLHNLALDASWLFLDTLCWRDWVPRPSLGSQGFVSSKIPGCHSLAAVVNLDKRSAPPKETSAHELYVTRDHVLMSTNKKTPQKSESTQPSLVRDS